MARKMLATAFLLFGLVATAAYAGVPKVIVIEEFGATW
jgi:hypothetical protein